MDLLTYQKGDILVIQANGPVDSAKAGSLETEVRKSIETGKTRIAVDLKDVVYMDSMGMGILLRWISVARKAGGDLKLARVGDRLMATLKLSALNAVFEIYGTVDEAVAAFANPRQPPN